MKLDHLTIKPGYILRELGGEFCIAFEGDTNNGAIDDLPSINETGIFLWTKLEQGYSLEELVSLLASKNDLDLEDAREDVGEFLAKLINGHIVE